MIWLISAALAGTLQIQPDRVSLRVGDDTTGFFTVKNTGTGRVSGSVDVTVFGDGVGCSPADIDLTPSIFRLLPGHEHEIQVHYTGALGCVSAAGITVGTTEIVIPILVGDDDSIPVVVSAMPLGSDEVVLQFTVLGNAPVQAHVPLVQMEVEYVVRLPNVSVVLLPHECTRIYIALARPLTSATVIQGVVLSANGTEHSFATRVSQPSAYQVLDTNSVCAVP